MRTATRFSGQGEHHFIALILPLDAAQKIFGSVAPPLKKTMGVFRRWSQRDHLTYAEFLNPPVPKPAQQAWFLAKVIEILSLHLFHKPQPEPFFCTTVKAKTHRYVRDALELLGSRLDQALDLESLARDVGCAPHYLSRLVKQDTGRTLSLHLRAIRIEKAAELLAGNRLNVTEVALEVGYNSLSHFSKAFAAEKNLTPSAFLNRQK